MQKKCTHKKISFKSLLALTYASTAFICVLTLLIQASLNKHDIFFELLSLKVPFIYGVEDLEKIEEIEENSSSPSSDKLLMELVGKTEIKSLSNKNTLKPTILIYHTHATEAYTPTRGYEYEATTAWRTNDEGRSVLAVGEELYKILTEKYGFCVIHDKTNHEPPKLSSAYSRSVLTMEDYKKKYPSIEVFIDVHRDAYGKDEGGMDDIAKVDGKECARLMFVVGTGKGATGSGFGEMPDFESNYALAENITNRLNDINPNLTRKIRVKTGRYNQHISDKCLLVEVGHNANSLHQALNSVEYLASAINDVLTLPTVKELDFSA